MVPFVAPRALQIDEMLYLVRQYFPGARNAIAAEFDGVEVHGANGYLLEQFVTSGTNRRDNVYGGEVEQRARLLMNVVGMVTEVWGSDRVGEEPDELPEREAPTGASRPGRSACSPRGCPRWRAQPAGIGGPLATAATRRSGMSAPSDRTGGC